MHVLFVPYGQNFTDTVPVEPNETLGYYLNLTPGQQAKQGGWLHPHRKE